jgi:hypothetical protein
MNRVRTPRWKTNPGAKAMTDDSTDTPHKVWTWNKENGGQFANINRPVAGPTHDIDLRVGRHLTRDDQRVGAELGQRGAPSWTVTMRVPARDQSYAAAKREIGPEPIDHRRDTISHAGEESDVY